MNSALSQACMWCTVVLDAPARRAHTAHAGARTRVAHRAAAALQVKYACGLTDDVIWEAKVVVGNVVANSAKYVAKYGECTYLPLNITDTCASNPGCAVAYINDPNLASRTWCAGHVFAKMTTAGLCKWGGGCIACCATTCLHCGRRHAPPPPPPRQLPERQRRLRALLRDRQGERPSMRGEHRLP